MIVVYCDRCGAKDARFIMQFHVGDRDDVERRPDYGQDFCSDCWAIVSTFLGVDKMEPDGPVMWVPAPDQPER